MALKLSLYLKKERDFVPLMIGLSSLGGIGSLLSLTPAYGLYMVGREGGREGGGRRERGREEGGREGGGREGRKKGGKEGGK